MRLALAVALLLALAPAAQARPNILVLETDDQTVADMVALPKTRALIADRGTTFTNSFVSYSLCCPSRSTLYTGQYAHNHGVLSNKRCCKQTKAHRRDSQRCGHQAMSVARSAHLAPEHGPRSRSRCLCRGAVQACAC